MSTVAAPRTSRTTASTGTSREGTSPRRVGLYVLLVVLTLIFISPLIYMLVTSFKTTAGAAASVRLAT